MDRLAVSAGVVLAALAGGASASAQTTTPAPAPAPATPLRATLDSCQTAPTAADRSVVFSGSMPPIARTWRMRMRFDLYSRRASSARWHRVAAPKWGIWHSSRPRVPGFVFTKVVDRLDAPASYRAIVRFRWYDRRGEILRSAHRTTAACSQPDPRPELKLSAITAVEVSSSVARYTLVVRNAGLGTAAPFDIVLAVGDRRVPIAIGAELPSGLQRAVTIEAPSCVAAGKLSITLDSGDAVDEASEREIPLVRACPL